MVSAVFKNFVGEVKILSAIGPLTKLTPLNVVSEGCSSVESHHLALDLSKSKDSEITSSHNTIAQNLCEVFITFFNGVSVKSETITKIWFPPVQRNNNEQRNRESALYHKTTEGAVA